MTSLISNIGKDRPSPDAMSIGEHLAELRRRIVVCVIAFAVAAGIAVFAYEPILHVLIRPLCDVDAANSLRGSSTLDPCSGAMVRAISL